MKTTSKLLGVFKSKCKYPHNNTNLYWFQIPHSRHGKCDSRVEVPPRHSPTNKDPNHEGQAIAHTNVEEPTKELILPSSIAQHYLGNSSIP